MKKIISIALSDGKLYIVRMELERGMWTLRGAEKILIAPLAHDADVGTVFEKKLPEHLDTLGEISNTPVAVVLPEERCYVHTAQLDQQTNPAIITKKIVDEIANVMPITRNEAEIRWEYNKTKKRAVAAAAKKNDITSLRVASGQLKLHAEALLLYPEPLARWKSLQNDRASGAVVIDCGEYRTSVTFFDEEGFLGSYILKKWDENIHTLIARHCHVSSAQAHIMRKSIGMSTAPEGKKLLEFLEREFDDARRECVHLLEIVRSQYQKSFTTFLFVGEIADTPHLIEYFHKQIGGTVSLADPWHSIQSVPQHLRRDTSFAAAIGGAMRYMDPPPDAPPINLNGISPPQINQSPKTMQEKIIAFYQFVTTRLPTITKPKRTRLAVVIGTLIAAGVLLWKIAPTISPTAVLPKEINLAIFVGTGEYPGAVKGTLWETDISIADTFAATGVKETPLVASGTVRLINKTSEAVHLRAAIRLVPENKPQATYRMITPANIPAHGTKDVAIAAEEADPEWDIQPGIRLIIPGLSTNLQLYVYSEVTEPIESSFMRVAIITEEDIQNAVAYAKQRAAAQALKLFKGQATDKSQTFLREPITTTIIEENVFAEPGDIGESFSLSLRTHISIISFPQEDAWQHIGETLQWNEDQSATKIDRGKELRTTFINYNPETKVVHIRVLLSDNNTP